MAQYVQDIAGVGSDAIAQLGENPERALHRWQGRECAAEYDRPGILQPYFIDLPLFGLLDGKRPKATKVIVNERVPLLLPWDLIEAIAKTGAHVFPKSFFDDDGKGSTTTDFRQESVHSGWGLRHPLGAKPDEWSQTIPI